MDGSDRPQHVSAALVQNYDPFRDAEQSVDPFARLREIRGGPDVTFNPRHYMGRGAWTVSRARLLREILQSPDLYSSKGCSQFSTIVGERWDMIPLELDPPAHTKFRTLLNPFFSSDAVNRLAPRLRDRAGSLIDRLKGVGACEFIEDFGTPLPATVMLELLGLPPSQLETFIAWERDLLHQSDLAKRIKAAREILQFMRTEITARKANPKNGMISFVANAAIEDEPITDDESLGICYLLFVGGLDTVTASLGYAFRHLAEHPQTCRLLCAEPAQIPGFVEEMLRLHSVVPTRRTVMRDHEFHGVTMKKGDIVECITALGSLDGEEFEDPDKMKIGRSPNRHFAFSAGPHRCIGALLARCEMRVAIEEWLKRIPAFRIQEGAVITSHAGVLGLDRLPLVWNRDQ